MKNCLIILTTALTLLACSSDQASSQRELLQEKIEILLENKMKTTPIPGFQVAVLNPSWDKMIKISKGVMNLESKEKLTNETQIKVGSISKSFTGIGILLLQQKGLIHIDEPLSKYITVNNTKYSELTIRKLLNMSSGLRDYVNDDDLDLIINEIIKNPNKYYKPMDLVNYGFKMTENLENIPDNSFHYNNTGYILLGMIIEKVSGLSYANFIKQNLLSPLMLNSSFIPENNNYGLNISKGYHFDGDEVSDFSNIDLSYVWSAGALISTASDLCNWINAVGRENIITSPISKYIYEGHQVADNVYYTAGLISEEDKIWHNGTVLGYHGELWFLKKSKISIAVLSNGNNANSEADIVKELTQEIANLLK